MFQTCVMAFFAWTQIPLNLNWMGRREQMEGFEFGIALTFTNKYDRTPARPLLENFSRTGLDTWGENHVFI